MYLDPLAESQSTFSTNSFSVGDGSTLYEGLDLHSNSHFNTSLLKSSSGLLDSEFASVSLSNSSVFLSSTSTSYITLHNLINAALEESNIDLDYAFQRSLSQASVVVRDYLTGITSNDEFDRIFGVAFRSNYNQQAADFIYQDFSREDFGSLPLVSIASSSALNGAEGVYVAQDDSIFLSDQLVSSGDIQAIAAVILEEIGHAIDNRINSVDSPGDEGYIFSALVQGKALSSDELAWLKQEDDQAWLEYNGQMVLVEQSLPTVTLSVPDANAAEVNTGQTRNPGSFRVSRTGSTATALTVNYNIGGTATNGADYNRLSGRVVIPIGASSVAIPITVTNDNFYEVAETVRISLKQNSAYTLGASSIGRVTIADNDPAPRIRDRDSNNNLSTAFFIGAWQRNIPGISGQGFVGAGDSDDFYRFTLGSNSNINLTLSGLSQGGVYLDLIRDINGNGIYDSNERLYSDTAYTSYNGVINTALGTGTYFVRVRSPYTNINTNYTLSLAATATPPTTPRDPGSTLGTALNIGTLTTSRSFRDFVGVVDSDDFYRFTLGSNSNVNLTLSGLSQGGVYLDLIRDINGNGIYDSNERLYSDTAYTSYNGVINTALGTGTYFVRVRSPYTNINTNYTLSFSRLVA